MNEPVGIAIGAFLLITLVWSAPGHLTEVRALGGRRAAQLVAVVFSLAYAVNAFAIVFFWPPAWLAIAAIGAYQVAFFRPRWVIKLTGGPVPLLGLMYAHDELSDVLADATTARANTDEVRVRLAAMDRWRTPETSDYIDRYQQWTGGLLGDPPVDDDDEEADDSFVSFSNNALDQMRAAGIDIERVVREHRPSRP